MTETAYVPDGATPGQNVELDASGDVILRADTDITGTGDLIFKTAGIERARISATGIITGFPANFTAALSTSNTASQNTAALNTALAAAIAGNAPLNLPTGTFHFLGPITIDPNDGFKLVGVGAGSASSGVGTGRTVLINDATDGSDAIHVNQSRSTSFVEFADFSLVGSSQSGRGLVFDSVQSLNYLLLRRLNINNHGSDNLVLNCTADSITVEQVESVYSGRYAIVFGSGTHYISNVTFIGCTAARATVGLFLSALIGNCTWIGGEFSYSGVGLQKDTDLSSQGGGHLKCLGATFEGNTTYQALIDTGTEHGSEFENVRVTDTAAIKLTEHFHFDGVSGVKMKNISYGGTATGAVGVGVYNNAIVDVERSSGVDYDVQNTAGTKIALGPTKWTSGKIIAANGFGAGNSVAATTLGNVVKKMQIFDSSGASLGYIPVYDAIT